MKTTAVSTLALQTLLRSQVQNQQSELTKAQKEATTGIYADIGLALGARTASAVDMTNDINSMQATIDSNSIADMRLSSSQSALDQISSNAQTALNALLTISGDSGQSQIRTAQNEIKNAFVATTSASNMSASGEYLFSGINTDSKPLNDYFGASGAGAKADFDAAFSSYFGFPQSDPAVSNITGAQMSDFISTKVAPMFDSPQWEANWSNASDTPMTSRIGASETVQTSTTVNTEGFRKVAMASVLGVELLGLNLSSDARSSVKDIATQAIGEGIDDIDTERSTLGVSQSRVKKADDSLNSQMTIVKSQINDLESVDPYDAATRVNTLTTQLETSYALTSRISQLSLLNYL